jgi:hypothetical protein
MARCTGLAARPLLPSDSSSPSDDDSFGGRRSCRYCATGDGALTEDKRVGSLAAEEVRAPQPRHLRIPGFVGNGRGTVLRVPVSLAMPIVRNARPRRTLSTVLTSVDTAHRVAFAKTGGAVRRSGPRGFLFCAIAKGTYDDTQPAVLAAHDIRPRLCRLKRHESRAR